MRLCVFCGSSSGRGDRYRVAAADVGRVLAERGVGLVYGGADVGTMGVLADACLDAGGTVVGVIPRQLVDHEVAHRGLTDLHVVGGMHERKALMADLADGFLALPGGIGTLEEFFEIWTWGHLRLHEKPLALLDVDGFYQPLIAFVDHMTEEGFLQTAQRDMVLVGTEVGRLLDRMADYRPPADLRVVAPDPDVVP